MPGLLQEESQVGVGGEGQDLEAFPVRLHHLQGLAADGAGGAQDDQMPHAAPPPSLTA